MTPTDAPITAREPAMLISALAAAILGLWQYITAETPETVVITVLVALAGGAFTRSKVTSPATADAIEVREFNRGVGVGTARAQREIED